MTKAIRNPAARGTACIRFLTHALEAMDDDGFDQLDVLRCLRKGIAHAPEMQNHQSRANVVHRGFGIRVAVGGLDAVDGDWMALQSLTVVTVMKVR